VVSSEVAKSMAKNAKKLFKADYALAQPEMPAPKKGKAMQKLVRFILELPLRKMYSPGNTFLEKPGNR
jgi:hypothetical protein